MNKVRQPLFWSVVASILLVVVVSSIIRQKWPARQQVKSNPGISPTTQVQSTPLELTEARQVLRMPLPDGASNIQNAGYSEFVAYEFLLKFEAPLEVCKTYAITLAEDHSESSEDDSSTISLEEFPREPDKIKPISAFPTPTLNVPWFDLHNIKRGFVIGEHRSHQPMIWIDSDREVFYYYYSD